ncbi:unnamed protein product [Schistosoma rodhaini]|uniref:Uncharacterized protein n=1 Tax=Schistosoma rodhaini TaxID=6188 RepID=A0AA85G9G4_9TREM|nr:unnamed protein product [Schistosoma rodhaini]CAH8622549.1 unnamed protein product [Schistosoma rodhaini]
MYQRVRILCCITFIFTVIISIDAAAVILHPKHEMTLTEKLRFYFRCLVKVLCHMIRLGYIGPLSDYYVH